MALCGADCSNCGYGKNCGCKGCDESIGCPFGKQCFIYSYIKTGGMENYLLFKEQLLNDINALQIEGMPEITELFPLNGSFVNMAYPMPNGEEMKFLNNDDIYLGNQVECMFNDGEVNRCFGIVANQEFILVAEYGANGVDPELIMYKKR